MLKNLCSLEIHEKTEIRALCSQLKFYVFFVFKSFVQF